MSNNQSQPMQVLTSSESNSWYTPIHVIEMVREVLGEIDLDPASHPVPQRWIQANTYYTEQDDGLKYDWSCYTLFLNPPYGKTGTRSNQDIWAEKLSIACRASKIYSGAILLTKTVPGYKWWDNLFNGGWPGPCSITRDRLSFVRGNVDMLPTDKTGKSKAASTFWYYGADPELFNKVFSEIGRVIPPGDLY